MAIPTNDSCPNHAPIHDHPPDPQGSAAGRAQPQAGGPTHPRLVQANAARFKAMHDPCIQVLGRTIQAHREHREMSRDELSLDIGVSHEQLRRYELGTNRVSALKLLRIAEALDVPIDVLLAGVEDPRLARSINPRLANPRLRGAGR